MSAGSKARSIERQSRTTCHGGHDDAEKPRTRSQLRLVARFHRGLALRLAQRGLVVDDLADAGKAAALDLRVLRPKPRTHQGFAAVEIGFRDLDTQHRTR